MTVSPPIKAPRDERLDFFRGLAMFIIFVAHLPGNAWFDYIPARFGFSSAAELFVFCSGFASALAFGRVFQREGWFAGARRILHRIWQVYWAHLGLAVAMIALSALGLWLTGTDYPAALGLTWFSAHASEGVLKLMLLGFTPNFLDILPMYLVLLALVPVVVPLGRASPTALFAAMALVWGLAQFGWLALPGGQEPGMVWFFNPFGWQLVFFTGFAFGMGWLKAPELRKGALFWLCVAALAISVPLNFWAFTDAVPLLNTVHEALLPGMAKTNLNPLLYLHFLASAYVALVLVEPVRGQLTRFRPVVLVGQQALAAFLASILLAWAGGMVLDQIGRSVATTALVNLTGFAGLILVAAIARDYKGGGKGRDPKPVARPATRDTGKDATPSVPFAVRPAE